MTKELVKTTSTTVGIRMTMLWKLLKGTQRRMAAEERQNEDI